ncbi:MAG: alginate export family protein [Sinimarinibacterium flocculans]|uniref:alginate export family protein n=1 Tax=Sinimarinibacterium flocculans TaxID=985250 RepID=UPI003C494F50
MSDAARTGAGIALLAGCMAAFAAERPGFAAHRYDEDWRSYCAHARQPGSHDRIKCLSPGDATLISVGGEWRERIEAVDAPDFGIDARSDAYILHRGLLHADLRHDEWLRGFVQLGSLHQNGRAGGPAPTDADDVDLQQGFVDLSALIGSVRARLRTGRQEMSLGSSRLISARESPNARRAFDGVQLRLSLGRDAIDAFHLRPLTIEPGAFDNRRQDNERLRGLQWTRTGDGHSVEIYYLELERPRVSYAGGRADEHRRSLGSRLSGHHGRADWNFELVAQSGDWGLQRIRAWTVASDSGYTLGDLPTRPRLSLKLNVASGDGDADDATLRTFNALYPNPTYFSEASLVAPANIVDVQPTLTLSIGTQSRLTCGWDFLWKHRRADAVYAPPGTPLAGSAGGHRFIGDQVHLGLMHAPSPSWQLRTAWVHFNAGDAVQQAGGDDVNYWTASAAYRF